jgi:glycosidase
LASSITQITRGVEDLLTDPMSVLNHYRKVASVRNKYPLFKRASFTSLNSGNTHVIAYKLASQGDAIVVVTNNSNMAQEVDVSSFAGTLLDEIDSSNLKARLLNGKLGLGAFSSAVLSSL